SYDIFIREQTVEEEKTIVIFEITLANLKASGEIDERDFMDRAQLLCSLGHTVMISKFQEYYKLVEYFNNYTKARLGLTMGVSNLVDVFDEKYYRHLSGGILEAFGKLFFKNLKVYLYPMKDKNTGQILTSNNIKVHPRMKELYKFFKYNGKVMDIIDYDPDVLHIFSRDVLRRIASGEEGWQDMLPEGVAELITKNDLFKTAETLEPETQTEEKS
ncbi:MAG: TonB-dependent receptor, partial [Bacteroidia bacterium]|nr:TonB-dependent receptor [Bacteroidia bacterium]